MGAGVETRRPSGLFEAFVRGKKLAFQVPEAYERGCNPSAHRPEVPVEFGAVSQRRLVEFVRSLIRHFDRELVIRKIGGCPRCLDCLCVPSLNSTESFGLVQIEAMHNDVPKTSSRFGVDSSR